ncbi:MAG: hypothetical protein MO846_10515 [Candidatus Devosia symbiotica]|nr:hypothetical protein [Candidatus Devosia symbiotica]
MLNFFDQIRFFPVSHEELTEARVAFLHGAYPLRIEETQFSYADFATKLAHNASSITTFKTRQQTAFNAERNRWEAEGLDSFIADDTGNGPLEADMPGRLLWHCEQCVRQYLEDSGRCGGGIPWP